MNRFNDRHSDLLYHLFYEGTWCSLNDLSSKIGYSKSTLWRDLLLMESNLPNDWKIEKNEMNGVRLIKPQNGTLEQLWSHHRSENTYFQTLELILFNNGVTINEIIQQVHISRSTAYRQLEKIGEVVKSAGVQLSNHPYKIIGEEKKIRRFMMQYVEYMSGNIYDYITSFDFDEFHNTLLKLLKEHSMTLHVGAIQKLGIFLHISNTRIRHECFVTFSKTVIEDYENSKAFKISKRLFKFMGKITNRDNQIHEVLIFSLYLMSEEMHLNRSQELRNFRLSLDLTNGKSLKQFLKVLSKNVGFDISQDDTFMYNFAQTMRGISYDIHLNTDTRLNNILHFVPYFEKNPLYILIEEIATTSFEPLIASLESVEILEIFMLVQAMLLRKKNQIVIEAALVCRSYVEKDYIKEVLKRSFGNRLNINVMDFSEIDLFFSNNDLDIVITTDSGQLLDNGHIPIYKVSSFPTPSELKEIKEFTHNFFVERYNLNKEFLHPFEEEDDNDYSEHLYLNYM
ncbi:BglG family transcription antiterminator [Lysinibacillus cavernae]|uniref:BglG family transcription antiterminator n=1 Tax=Lysinibacillus cavernae TaxID=2666135 RepID=UPI0012D89ADA|nr:helix-turn-helix domain-containing protein [Lysinibacillus cavernae]